MSRRAPLKHFTDLTHAESAQQAAFNPSLLSLACCMSDLGFRLAQSFMKRSALQASDLGLVWHCHPHSGVTHPRTWEAGSEMCSNDQCGSRCQLEKGMTSTHLVLPDL